MTVQSMKIVMTTSIISENRRQLNPQILSSNRHILRLMIPIQYFSPITTTFSSSSSSSYCCRHLI